MIPVQLFQLPSSKDPLARAIRHSLLCCLLLSPAVFHAPLVVAQAATRQVTLPAGDLGATLSRFAADTGVVIYFDASLTAGLTTPGIRGEYSVYEALQQLLAGSGLQVIRENDGSYRLVRQEAGVLPAVKVSADAAEGSAETAYQVKSADIGILGSRSLQNTPYSVEVFSQDLLQNLQARSLNDVAKLDASISLMPDNQVSENNTLAIRGLAPDGSTGQKLDGLTLRNRATDMPIEHIERVEILKGAGGFLYGFGTPGGTVNYVLKRPTETATASLASQLTDSGLWLVHGDIGGRSGSGNRFGYRVNAVHESGDTYVNDGESQRGSASLALDWRITPNLVWQVDALQSSHTRFGGYYLLVPNADGQSGNSNFSEPPAPIKSDKRLAPSWTRYGSEHEIYGTSLKWQIKEQWDISAAYRVSDNYRQFFQPNLYANVDGNYSASLYNYNSLNKSAQSQLLLHGSIRTGMIEHDLVVGTALTETTSANTPFANIPLGSGNLANPVEFAQPAVPVDKHSGGYAEVSRIERREWFISDTLHIGSQWDIILGARHGNLQNDYALSDGEPYDKSAVTPTLAAIYRPQDQLSLYASYVEAFEEGAIAPPTATNPPGERIFDPLISRQKEMGLKWTEEGWSFNMALFQLQRGLTYTRGDGYFTQDGEARYEGLEFSGKARLGQQWLLTASAMLLNAENKKTSNASLQGKPIQGVAEQQASAYAEYQTPRLPLILTAGIQYAGKRPVDTQSQWHVGPVTLFDAGARYVAQVSGLPLTMRLNINNLADKAYWLNYPGSGHLSQGSPRTIKFSVQVDF